MQLYKHFKVEWKEDKRIKCHHYVNISCIVFQTLAKVSRSEHTLLEQAREVIQRELEEETNDRLRKIKRSVLEPLQGSSSFLSTGNMERRKKYASMTAADVVLEVLTNTQGLFAPRMGKVGSQSCQVNFSRWW